MLLPLVLYTSMETASLPSMRAYRELRLFLTCTSATSRSKKLRPFLEMEIRSISAADLYWESSLTETCRFSE